MTLDAVVTITIPGNPAPKGSLKCVGRRGRVAHVLLEDNANAGPWRTTIAGWVTSKWPARQYADAGQAIAAEVRFTIDRPASHYGTGANRRVIKGSAPAWPVKRSAGDVDKLLRLILDALQDGDDPVLPDDAAVVEVATSKVYVGTPYALDWPGVRIRLRPARAGGALTWP